MAELLLKAKKREKSTKGAVNQLRRDGYVPGVFYSKGTEPIALYVQEAAINKFVFTKETHIAKIEFEGSDEEYNAIVKDVQFDPITDKVIHFDLHGLKAGEAVDVEVPVKIVGTAKGVRMGGKLQIGVHKLPVRCLPKHIPSVLEINVSDLGVGKSIHVRDLNIENIEFPIDPSVIIAQVTATRNTVEAGDKETEK